MVAMCYAQCPIGRIASLGREPTPISLHFVKFSCLCSAVSTTRWGLSLILMCAVVRFLCLVIVAELFWKYLEHTCSVQTAKQV